MIRLIFVVFATCALQSVVASDLSKAKVEYTAVANPGFLTVDGEGVGVEGKIDGEVGDVSFDLRKLKDKHLSLRNTHTQEDLHVKEHPIAVMRWHGPVADLTLNGVTKTVALIHEGNKYSFDVVLSEFGLKGRQFAGVGIGDKASVTVEIP